ncbi:MAG: hypothetical protein ACHQQ3_13280 [Gemmatimonadales bacterium]
MTMPRQKDLKRLVRRRMRKTGEAYTAARAHIITKSPVRPAVRPAAPSAPLRALMSAPDPREYAALAGMSDASVKAKTGCPWERWVRALDRLGAPEMSHRDIVAVVKTKYKVGPWWSQMVAVGYERIRGVRARGQKRDGTYEATRSRTFAVPVTKLFEAWADPDLRRRWLDGATVTMRRATTPKSMRLDWSGHGIVAVGFTAKGASRSTVALAEAKIPDRETAARIKQYWSERLEALGDVLAER